MWAICINVAREVNSCKDFQAVELGAYYNDYFICCCESCLMLMPPQAKFAIPVKSDKGPTPLQISHPSRPSFDVDKMGVQQRLQHSPTNYQKTKSKVSKVHIP
jgi:hypothetical protein